MIYSRKSKFFDWIVPVPAEIPDFGILASVFCFSSSELLIASDIFVNVRFYGREGLRAVPRIIWLPDKEKVPP